MEIDYTKRPGSSHDAADAAAPGDDDVQPTSTEHETPDSAPDHAPPAPATDEAPPAVEAPPAPSPQEAPPTLLPPPGQDAAATSAPATPKPPFRWSRVLVPVGVVGVLALVAGFIYMLPGAIDEAKPGDCVAYDRSNADTPYSTVRCGSSSATFTVLQVVDGEGNCRGVAGATRSTISTEHNVRREVCLGPKDVDPATAVNVAQVGDCLTGTGNHEVRVPCSDPAATSRILRRVNDVSNTQVRNTCDQVPGAVSVYSWTWDTDDGTGPSQASYQTDAVFCLGPVN